MRLPRQQQEKHQIAERASSNATILVVNPPRERPMA
jgi:hypothetical protein